MKGIQGAHAIIYSRNAEADRDFLRDVLGLPHVDAGGGWLIFALPPAEVAVHPGDENDVHEFFLITKDLKGLIAGLAKRGIPCAPPEEQRWGVLTHVSLPGGGRLGVYEPRHARPSWSAPVRRRRAGAAKPKRRPRRRNAR